MYKLIVFISSLAIGGCSTVASNNATSELIRTEIRNAAAASAAARVAEPVPLMPPVTQVDKPREKAQLQERISFKFNNVPAAQFFMAIVSGTRYNMLVHPEVAGTISASLKDVTLVEALDAIRELYGYDYKIEGNRIVIMPLTMQTSIFQVNYLTGNRRGTSETRVTGGSISDSRSSGNGNGQFNNNNANNNNGSTGNTGNTNTGAQGSTRSLDSSRISTSSDSDFWSELKVALEAIAGGGREGHSVVISPQSGVVVVRAFPGELRSVTRYLKAMQLSVDRQVILEAKILEVELNDSFQSGINWAAFTNNSNSRLSVGLLGQNTTLKPGTAAGAANLSDTRLSSLPGANLVTGATKGLGGLFGLAFQTSNFAGLISFLESQGNVHVLSSPRIATLNNQKAVLKVGTDEFFVTGISTTTTSTGTSAVTTPSVILQPFFSGVVLDVTPQIDDRGNIVLHVHPSVSDVTTVNKSVNIGSSVIDLPLASSNTSETDSIVRGRDGQVIAIGGLMRQSAGSDRSQLPGVGSVPVLGGLFGSTSRVSQKRELVILLRPTVVQADNAWSQDILDGEQRGQTLDPRGVPSLR